MLEGNGESVAGPILGIDFSAHATEQARANAAERNVTARFEVADALQLAAQHDEITALRQQIQARPERAVHRLLSAPRQC